MARPRQLNDSTTIKFASGGSLTLIFKGNMFDLLPKERALISDLSITIQRFNEGPERELLVETKQA